MREVTFEHKPDCDLCATWPSPSGQYYLSCLSCVARSIANDVKSRRSIRVQSMRRKYGNEKTEQVREQAKQWIIRTRQWNDTLIQQRGEMSQKQTS